MDEGWQKYIESLDTRLGNIEQDTKSLLQFKWQIFGITAAVAVFFGLIVQLVLVKVAAL